MLRKGRLNFTTINEDVVTKIAWVSDKTRRQRLNREKWALNIAKNQGLLVPVVVDYGHKIINGKKVEVLITRRIFGKELSFIPNTTNIKAMQAIGKQLSNLKPLVGAGFGWPGHKNLTGEFKTWKSFLLFFTKKCGKKLIDYGIISNELLNTFCKKIQEFNFEIAEPFLIHRDIKPANILRTNKGVYLIDWENALLGDSLFDLAQFEANYGRKSLWKALAKGLNLNYCQKKYVFYEIIAIIGIIDFCYKQKINFN